MYIKNTIQYSVFDNPIHNVNNADLEMTSLKISLPNVRPIFVVSIYRPPSRLTDNFRTHISNMLNDIVQTRKFDIYIGGDFNIDYKKKILIRNC